MNNFTVSEQTAESAKMAPYMALSTDPMGRYNVSNNNLEPLPLDNGEPENDVNCMLFYMNNYKAEDLRGLPFGTGGAGNAGGEFNDSAKGIYHMYIGAEGGLVKSIDFTRTDVQGLREARQAESRNLGQIRDVYDAKVTLLGVKDKPGIAAAIFKPLSENSINVDMVVQNISANGKETDLTFTIKSDDLKKTKKIILNNKNIVYRDLKFDKEVSKISIIGVGMVTTPGVTFRMFQKLADKKINILVISTSEIKISVLIEKRNVTKALKALHKEFGLDK